MRICSQHYGRCVRHTPCHIPVSAFKPYLFDIKLGKIPVPTLLRAPLKQEFTIIPQRPTINLSLQKTLRRGFSTIILKISRYFQVTPVSVITLLHQHFPVDVIFLTLLYAVKLDYSVTEAINISHANNFQ